ncbi:predicted protein [Histoplasma mississippiense (nom. inval.)]|uniref:predicted protein n=1 Tax=Ajellomyces capsulatus (strain NAm1 / WU24) TaxID=2059318 RepID=UPI000157D46C|nr:predicted protein [Histoplasma mississippiense (nom. inval.)]EDN05376.1 predicted protein [Histoplasma mississippiense (nom. inval.)]
MFVNESLESQIKHLLALDREQDDDEIDYGDGEGQSVIQAAMDKYRAQLEDMFAKGIQRRTRGQRKFKPKPSGWDSEFDGPWEDQPGALIISDNEADEDVDENAPPRRGAATSTGRGRGRGGSTSRGSASRATNTRKKASPAPPPAPPPAPSTKTRTSRYQTVSDHDGEDEEGDAIMLDDINEDEEGDSDSLFVRQTPASC